MREISPNAETTTPKLHIQVGSQPMDREKKE